MPATITASINPFQVLDLRDEHGNCIVETIPTTIEQFNGMVGNILAKFPYEAGKAELKPELKDLAKRSSRALFRQYGSNGSVKHDNKAWRNIQEARNILEFDGLENWLSQVKRPILRKELDAIIQRDGADFSAETIVRVWDDELLLFIIEEHKDLLNQITTHYCGDGNYASLLHQLPRGITPSTLKALLNEVHVNQVDRRGNTLLHSLILQYQEANTPNSEIHPHIYKPEIVGVIIESHPEALLVKNIDGYTPLALTSLDNTPCPAVEEAILAYMLRSGADTILYASEGHPSIINRIDKNRIRAIYREVIEKDKYRRTLWHKAVLYMGSDETYINWLCNQLSKHYLGNALTQDRDGNTPLHLAAMHNPSLIPVLLKLYPQALLIANNEDQEALGIVLEIALHDHSLAALVTNLLKKTDTDEKGQTLLHKACYHGYYRQWARAAHTLKTLYDLCPEAISIRDKNGDTPLHFFIKCNHNLAPAWLELTAAIAEVSRVKNNQGNTPLHLAIIHAPKLAPRLLELDPEVLLITNHEGKTPRDLALQNSLRFKTVLDIANYIVSHDATKNDERYTNLLTTLDEDGNTLLHKICSLRSWLDTDYDSILNDLDSLKAVYNAYRAAAMLKNKDGNTPLHLAASNNPSLVPVLLELEPRAGFVLNNRREFPYTSLLYKYSEAGGWLYQYSIINDTLEVMFTLGAIALGLWALASLGVPSFYLAQIMSLLPAFIVLQHALQLPSPIFPSSMFGNMLENHADYFTMLVSKPKTTEEQSPRAPFGIA